MVLSNIEPREVFSWFEQLSAIPRGSGNEGRCADVCVEFASKYKLAVTKDEWNNVIIKKDGTFGLEHAPTVILQGHLDMVCEKNNDTEHNFDADGLKLFVDGDFVKARGTTLGADNGIAVAICLAILESSSIKHPPLEVVFTSEEEVGLIGASKLDKSGLRGEFLVNLDTEEEGEFVTSCAGGVRVDVKIPIRRVDISNGLTVYKLTVSGLKGGHSGMDIDKGRGNANKILGRMLYELSKNVSLSVVELRGGLKDNSIPREAFVVFATDSANAQRVSTIADEFRQALAKEFRATDDGLTVTLSIETEKHTSVLDENSSKSAILALNLVKNGVFAMSAEIAGLVETSSNIGKIRTERDEFVLTCAVRSSVSSRKKSVVNGHRAVADAFGGALFERGDYPAWEFDPDPTFRNKFVAAYEEMFGQTPILKGIHAGLEPGLFGNVAKKGMISIGPTMFDVHSPNERLSISSVQRFWEFFLKVLGTLQ